mgnify:CR=1 FL=1
MTYKQAKKLHKGDEVIEKKTAPRAQMLYVVFLYPDDGTQKVQLIILERQLTVGLDLLFDFLNHFRRELVCPAKRRPMLWKPSPT